jgi:NADPH oxidase
MLSTSRLDLIQLP